MAVLTLQGFLLNDAGAGIEDATILVYTRNTANAATTDPVSPKTDADGKWTCTVAAEGRYDVKITNGSSVRWLKYDDAVQLTEIEAAVIRLRGTDNAFDIKFQGTPSADRTVTFPNQDFTIGSEVTVQAAAEVFNGAAPIIYTDLDLSGSIGAQRTVVLLRVSTASGTNENVHFRPNGDTGTPNTSASVTIGAISSSQICHVIVATDASGIIEWKGDDNRTTVIGLEAYWK